MSDIAIRVEKLGKRYYIGKRERYHALRDTLSDALTAPFRWLRRGGSANGNGPPELIWALKDISFEVPRGEIVGIIGRNGAGKSTLLKVLSRITEPTEGRAEIHGRVGSLLEVGTGFHPELTGRENVYLNGAILGMHRAEIARKFDEMVAFAEIEKFLDTPVKHYSSGMYMRLAFAVAAHLDPEILMVDEVLAVGDLAFQKKCLGKIGDVAKGGRTVIFVSHQMNQIRRLCGHCLWLHGGEVKMFAPIVQAVGAYEAALNSGTLGAGDSARGAHVDARFIKWEIAEPRGIDPHVLTTAGPAKVHFLVQVNKPMRDIHHGIALFSNENQLIWATATDFRELEPGLREFVYSIPSLPIRPGVYNWHVTIWHSNNLTDEWFCTPSMVVGTQPVTHHNDAWNGILNVPTVLEVR
jgi:ABC-type polysaccharide/polyol phosphate transport system ATPase subunit